MTKRHAVDRVKIKVSWQYGQPTLGFKRLMACLLQPREKCGENHGIDKK